MRKAKKQNLVDFGSGFFGEIRKIVVKIPRGRVTTYGAIAEFLGTKDARLVGYAMFGNQNPKIPCYRVVKKDGFLAKDYSLGGWQEQKRRLLKEGVVFLEEKQVKSRSRVGNANDLQKSFNTRARDGTPHRPAISGTGARVDLKKHYWEPK